MSFNVRSEQSAGIIVSIVYEKMGGRLADMKIATLLTWRLKACAIRCLSRLGLYGILLARLHPDLDLTTQICL